MKIYHLGAYGTNLGDTVALLTIRKYLSDHLSFVDLNINQELPIKNINESGGLLIGGGGLIEGGGWNNNQYGWKLKITPTTLDLIKVPIVVFGVGLNFFRGLPELSSLGVRNLNALIKKAAYFSVRNDGSYEKLNQILTSDKVKELPDPGLISNRIEPQKSKLNSGCFNVAVNNNSAINLYRKIAISDMNEIAKTMHLPIFPHTPKDFRVKGDLILNNINAKNVKQLDLYHNYDYCIAMRGHGQLVTYGKNIPGIYLSSQDKLKDFATKYALDEFLVDTTDANWRQQLIDKHKNLINNPQTWYTKRNMYINQFTDRFMEGIDEVSRLFK